MLRRPLRHFAPLLLTGALLGACSDEQPARGQLMVALSTDMSIPKDVSRVRIEITTDSGRRFDFNYDIAPDGKFYLPGTLSIVAGEKPSERVKIQVIGIRRNADRLEARTLSKVITTVPKSRIALVPLPIQWLCDGSALSTDVPGGEPEYLSSCERDADGQERACVAGECVAVDVAEEALPDFVPPNLVQGEPAPDAPIEDGSCFDAVACFEAGQDVVPDEKCSFGTTEERELNVGLQLAPGGDGICDEANPEAACYIPLSRSDTSGWREETAGGVRTIYLPSAVCTKLDAGEVQAVRLTAACPTKTEGRATCGPWTQQDAPSEPVPGPPIVVVDAGSEAGAGGEGGTGGTGNIDTGGTGNIDTGGTGNIDTGGMPGAGSSAGGTTSIAGTASDGGSLSGQGGSTGTGGSGVVVGGGGSDFGGSAGSGGASAQAGAGAEGGLGGFGGMAGIAGDTASGGAAGGGTGPGVTDCANGPLLFADAQLEARLREVLELATGPIMPVHVAGLTNLVMSSRGIASLDGLECLMDLQLLDLSMNNVSDLSPLGKLGALSVLDLSANQVTSLAQLMPVTSLTKLLLPLNNVSDLSPLVANLGVDAGDLVDLSGNPIDCETQGFNITQLQSRNVVLATDCSQNTDCINGPLTFVDLGLEQAVRDQLNKPVGAIMPADAAQLTTLDASLSGIMSLSGIECLTALQQLDLAANSLVDLSLLASLANLQSLDLSDNAIVDVGPLASLVQLQDLWLGVNQVSDLRSLLDNSGLSDSDFLDIVSNPLDCVIEHATIAQLRTRGVVVQTDCAYPPTDCEQGPLTFVDPNLEQAVRIAIGSATDPIMPANVSSLTFLSTGMEGGSGVHSLEGMQCLTQLRNVTLSDNFIRDVSPLGALSNLQTLNLSGNEIEDLGPLAQNLGLNEGDLVDARSNLVDCQSQGENITLLQDRFVEVYVDCPIDQ